MKLHAFDFEAKGRRYRAFTRDKSHKGLRQQIYVKDDDLGILPNQWKYVGPISTNGLSEHDQVRAIHASIKQRRFALVYMPPIHRDFYVYDKQLDVGNIRIYSKDKELNEFNHFWHLMEMRPNGEAFKGTAAKLVGEVKIPNTSIAKTMGIDFDTLQRVGFDIHFIGQTSKSEAFRRYMERSLKEELPRKLAGSGIEILDLTIESIKEQKITTEQSGSEAHENLPNFPDITDKTVNIENHNIVNVHSPVASDTTEKSEFGVFDKWWVKALGLVAALLGIWTFFHDDIAIYVNIFK
jgi:hypothetical protein